MRSAGRSLFVLLVVIHVFNNAWSQTSSSQIWNEYMLNIPSGTRFNLEAAVSYSTVLDQPKWRAFDFQITPEIAIHKHLDIMAALLLSSTFQSDALSTLEVREMLGVRIHLTPESRALVRALLRVEQRNLEDRETGQWDHSTRGRMRAELLFPFNAPTMSKDKTFYGIADVETFIVFDQDVQERFANRLRFRVGAGYRVNHSFRTEFIYMMQRSKNTLGTEIESVDNIFRVRLKHYLKSKIRK